MLYTALVASIAAQEPSLVIDLVNKLLEQAQDAYNEGKFVQAKTIFRFLGAAAEFRVINAKALAQLLIQVLESSGKAHQ